MEAVIERRIGRQRIEDAMRLADRAEQNRVRILVSPSGGHVATSASDPTRCYRVDPRDGCECQGYRFWGRCQHHSLLLSELGLLDPEPDPAGTSQRHPFNMSDAEMVVAKADAMRAHALYGEPLISVATGEVLAA